MSKAPRIQDIDISAWLDGEWDGDDAQMRQYLRETPSAQAMLDAWQKQGKEFKQMVGDLASPQESARTVVAVRARIEKQQKNPLARLVLLFDLRPRFVWGVAFALLLGVLSAPLWVYLWVNFIDGSVVREDTTVVKGTPAVLPEELPAQFEIKSTEKK